MSTFLKAFNSTKHIVVPSIQREYVQPLDKVILSGFVSTLLRCYVGQKHKDLNYLYGVTNEDNSFEPIDGQQRLTTMWLLHLYVAARNGEELTVQLEYQTRDIAADFCKALKANSRDVINGGGYPSQSIRDAKWFIESWKDSVSVNSMLGALDEIHNQINSGNIDFVRLWDTMRTDEALVTFAFKDTQSLGDDVYVKMNARGKSLSDFEKLKSWMDDKIVDLGRQKKLEDEFLTEWREKMDNDWTDLFWRNRNLNDEYPEEIDDEQLRLFYSLAYLRWAVQSNEAREEMVQVDHKNELTSLLNPKDGDVIREILSKLRLSSVDFQLYLLDKMDLMDAEYFLFTRDVLEGLKRFETCINETLQVPSDCKETDSCSKIYFWDYPDTNEPISFLCQLLMSEKNERVEYPKMVLAAALCYYVALAVGKDIQSDELISWMRFARNIVNNSDIDASNVHNVLSAFRNWAGLVRKNGWRDFIESLDTATVGINKSQLEEEKVKHHWVIEFPECADAMHKLENNPFFLGRIQYLIKFIDGEDCDEMPSRNSDSFIFYAKLLCDMFDKHGPKPQFAEEYRLSRAVLALSEYYGACLNVGSNWALITGKQEWKEYLEDFDKANSPKPHNIGFSRLLVRLSELPQPMSDKAAMHTLQRCINEGREYISDWRKDLVAHRGLWDYMNNKHFRFYDDYNVILIKGVALGKRNRRAELRTRTLYLELKYHYLTEHGKSKREDEVSLYDNFPINGWELRFWDFYCNEQKNSCLYFEKCIGNDQKIAIDIFYDTNLKKEEAYVLEILDRKVQSNGAKVHSELIQPYIDTLADLHLSWTDDSTLISKPISKDAVLNVIKDIVESK